MNDNVFSWQSVRGPLGLILSCAASVGSFLLAASISSVAWKFVFLQAGLAALVVPVWVWSGRLGEPPRRTPIATPRKRGIHRSQRRLVFATPEKDPAEIRQGFCWSPRDWPSGQ
jgi:hypothetical protein